VLFFLLPLIPVGGHPALQFDIAARRTHVFGGTFYPTDSLILVAFGFGIIVTVFFVGSTFGRMWCGYACPQTVWLEFFFRPIEAFLEGGPTNQRKLNLAPWSGRKFAIKAAKWSIWTAAALLMASTFMAYFTGWGPLVRGVAADPTAWKGALTVMAFVAGAILFDFSWFRDQMCTIACPYGRLQNVLADRDTILVAYDVKRGDPKVRLKDRLVGVLAGDCIACRACVNACPTGALDGRGGLDRSRCLAHLTASSKSPIPENIDPAGNIYGCDICQDVCPFNAGIVGSGPGKSGRPACRSEFLPRPNLFCPSLEWVLNMDDDAFALAFKGSPVFRRGRKAVQNTAGRLRHPDKNEH